MDYVRALMFRERSLEQSEYITKMLCGDNPPPELREMHEAERLSIVAIKKQIAEPVKVKDRKYQTDYYCPRCGKQQKLPGAKRLVFGSFCERCGQRLSFPDPKTGKTIEVEETTFVFEVSV